MEEDQITPLVERARSEEHPLTALYATVRLRSEVERLMAVHVRRARLQGATWAEIAMILGISKQAVHKKYGGRWRGG